MLLAVLAMNALGALPGILFGADTGWFESPWFFPPPVLFGIVWPMLFSLLGIAFFLVVRAGWDRLEVRRAVAWFGAQFALNLAWTPVFFGLRRPVAALGVIAVLFVLVIATVRAFDRVDRRAAILFVPYVAWLAFALVLNLAIAV